MLLLRLRAFGIWLLLVLVLLGNLLLLADHVFLGLPVGSRHVAHLLRYYSFLEIFLVLLRMLFVIVERWMHAANNLLMGVLILLFAGEELFLCDIVRLDGHAIFGVVGAGLLRAYNSSITRLVSHTAPVVATFLTTIYEEFTLCAWCSNNDFWALSIDSNSWALSNYLFNDGPQWRTQRLLNVVLLHLRRVVVGGAWYQLEYVVALVWRASHQLLLNAARAIWWVYWHMLLLFLSLLLLLLSKHFWSAGVGLNGLVEEGAGRLVELVAAAFLRREQLWIVRLACCPSVLKVSRSV